MTAAYKKYKATMILSTFPFTVNSIKSYQLIMLHFNPSELSKEKNCFIDFFVIKSDIQKIRLHLQLNPNSTKLPPFKSNPLSPQHNDD